MKINIRKATKYDLPAIVQLLANDPLGQKREQFTHPLPEVYYHAFDRINTDKNQHLIVAEDDEKNIMATLQLTLIPYLTYQGGIRAQVEAVRVKDSARGSGLGSTLLEWAIAYAREAKAHVIQLTTDKQRPEAIRFYEKMGFKATHEGMKLHLQ